MDVAGEPHEPGADKERIDDNLFVTYFAEWPRNRFHRHGGPFAGTQPDLFTDRREEILEEDATAPNERRQRTGRRHVDRFTNLPNHRHKAFLMVVVDRLPDRIQKYGRLSQILVVEVLVVLVCAGGGQNEVEPHEPAVRRRARQRVGRQQKRRLCHFSTISDVTAPFFSSVAPLPLFSSSTSVCSAIWSSSGTV